MRTCEFCGAVTPDNETFCVSCGKRASGHTAAQTSVDKSHTEATTSPKGYPNATIPLSTSPEGPKGTTGTNHTTIPIPTEPKAYHTVPLYVVEKEDEEERRRRIAMLDPEFDAPDEDQSSAGAIHVSPVADLTTHENIPQVAGDPQSNGAPQVQGTPPFGGGTARQKTPPQHYSPFGPQSGINQNAGSIANPGLSAQAAWTPPDAPYTPSMPSTPPQHSMGGQPSNRSQNWLKIGLIAGLVLSILIFSGMGLILMASTPTLTLAGSTDIVPGSILHLNGSHFLPNNTVTLTLDHTTPLYYSYQQPYHSAKHAIISNNMNISDTWILENRITQTSLASNQLKVGSNGTFSVNIQVGTDWQMGLHTIQAIETPGSRSATLSFTITQQTPIFNQETATPTTPTVTVTPTAPTVTVAPTAPDTPTSIPTAGITPTAIITSLSSATPNALTLGPASVGDQQAASSIVTLNTTGSALLTWNATWDQQQAPWLQLTPATGQLQAPASQKITVSAQSANLKAGTYKVLITFTNSLDTHTVLLPVVLTVQAGCLKVTSTSLNFVGTVGANDPAPQTVALNNCGSVAGTWNATTKADGNWLSIKPTSGSIDPNGTQAVTVSVAIASQKLAAGTYQGQIVFSSGGNQATVSVTLVVQSAPQLNVSQQQIAVVQTCKASAETWTCNETLSSPGALGELSWTSSVNGSAGVTITPASGTIAVGQTMPVTIVIPNASCTANFTLTFTGSTNSVDVPVDCSGTQQIT